MDIVNENSKVKISPDASSANIGNETVVLDSSKGEYFGLKGAGVRIWKILNKRGAINVKKLIEKLNKEYDVDRHVCEKETLKFLEIMKKKKIILVQNEKE